MNDVSLGVEELRLTTTQQPFDVRFYKGEIVGVAGLDGHGQSHFLEVLAGFAKPARGYVYRVEPTKQSVSIRSFRQAMKNGVAYLPRDRRLTGIFPTLSILDNFAIASMAQDSCCKIISARRRRLRFRKLQTLLSIVAGDLHAPIPTLSGGNQQKVLLARLLVREPAVLLLDDPMRGVDVATRRALYDVFRDLAAGGMTLIILSSEIEEAVALSRRVLVFREQRLFTQLSGDDLSHDSVLSAMFGKVPA